MTDPVWSPIPVREKQDRWKVVNFLSLISLLTSVLRTSPSHLCPIIISPRLLRAKQTSVTESPGSLKDVSYGLFWRSGVRTSCGGSLLSAVLPFQKPLNLWMLKRRAVCAFLNVAIGGWRAHWQKLFELWNRMVLEKVRRCCTEPWDASAPPPPASPLQLFLCKGNFMSSFGVCISLHMYAGIHKQKYTG